MISHGLTTSALFLLLGMLNTIFGDGLDDLGDPAAIYYSRRRGWVFPPSRRDHVRDFTSRKCAPGCGFTR